MFLWEYTTINASNIIGHFKSLCAGNVALRCGKVNHLRLAETVRRRVKLQQREPQREIRRNMDHMVRNSVACDYLHYNGR